MIVLLCCDSRLLSRAYTLLCVRRRRSRTRPSRRHCNGLSTRRSLCATLHFCPCLTWCVAAEHVVDDNARWGLSFWRAAHPSERLVGVTLVDPDRFCLPEDITNTGESRFTRLSLHHLRLTILCLQTLLFDSSVAVRWLMEDSRNEMVPVLAGQD